MSWDERFVQLERYHAEFGTCDVPRTFDEDLADWVRRQRSEYKQWREHGKPPMSEQRAARLNELGFSSKEPRGVESPTVKSNVEPKRIKVKGGKARKTPNGRAKKSVKVTPS